MLAAMLLLATGVADWVPMRWASADPKSLELIQNTPINCLLLETEYWTPDFIGATAKVGIVTLGVIRAEPTPIENAQLAAARKLSGVALEGKFEPSDRAKIRSLLSDSKLTIVELPDRAAMRFDASPVLGTHQGVWPGIQIDDGGSAKAAPSGAPWINTNSGFLRFLRAASESPVWIAHVPPSNQVITGERYLQAVADAAMTGARWVIALDQDFSKKLHSGDAGAAKEWKRITSQLAFFETNREHRSWRPLGQLAIVQDTESGALFSGGVLDMIAVKHTPVRPVPSRKLSPTAVEGTKMAVNVDPASLTDQQKESLRAFARSGGTLLSGPASWKFPPIAANEITLKESDVKMLDDIWKEVNTLTGRRNLGVRLFNVSSMLSNILERDGKAALYLVNYSGYPVENITVHLLGKYKSAKLIAPGVAPKSLDVYDIDEGTGVDIDTVQVTAALLLE